MSTIAWDQGRYQVDNQEPTSTGHDYDTSEYNRRLEEARTRGEQVLRAALNGPRIGTASPIVALMLADARGLTKGAALSAHRRLEPVLPRDRRAGRNDLCPCGSGRKRKHCHKE